MEYKISLRAARVNANLKQVEVASRIGVSKKSLANWENGRIPPKATILMKLCDIYGVPIDLISLP